MRAASRPWSKRTHALFPRAARERAADLLVIGRQLSRACGGAALGDVWFHQVMPFAVSRKDGQQQTA